MSVEAFMSMWRDHPGSTAASTPVAARDGWWETPPDMHATKDRYVVAPMWHLEGYWCIWVPGEPTQTQSGQWMREGLDLGHGGPFGSRWTNKEVALDVAYMLNTARERRVNDPEADHTPATRRIRREV